MKRQESYFDISKYAQINQVALSRNMMRYGHMDECGIGTDCRSEETGWIHGQLIQGVSSEL